MKAITFTKRHNQENYLVQSLDDFIQYIEKESSSIWTDYNDSDFGITLMEYIIFALYDIKYRLRLPILNYFNEDFLNDINVIKFHILQKENSSELIIQRLTSLFENLRLEVSKEELDNIIKLTCKSHTKINRKEKEKIARYILNRINKYRVLDTKLLALDLDTVIEKNETKIILHTKQKKANAVGNFVTDYRSIQEDLPEIYGFNDYATSYKKLNSSDKLALEQFRSFILSIDFFLADSLLSVKRIKHLTDFDEKFNRYKIPELISKTYPQYFSKISERSKCTKCNNDDKCIECVKFNEFIEYKSDNSLDFKENFIVGLCRYFDFNLDEFYGPYLKRLRDKDRLEQIAINYQLFKKGIEYKSNIHLGANLIYESSTSSFIKVLNKNFKILRPKTKLGFGYIENGEKNHPNELIDMSFLSDYWFNKNAVNVKYDKKSFDFDDFDELKLYNYLIANNLLKLDWVEHNFEPSSQIFVVSLNDKYYYVALKFILGGQVKYTYLGFHWHEDEAVRHAQLFYSFINLVNSQLLDDFSVLIETRFLSRQQTVDFGADILILIPVQNHNAEAEVLNFTNHIASKYLPMNLDVRIVKVLDSQYNELQPYYRAWRRALVNHIRKKIDLDYDNYAVNRFCELMINICKDAPS